jgi:hypothetical protein
MGRNDLLDRPYAETQQDSDDELAKIERELLERSFKRRRQLLKGAMTAPDVASMLGVERQTPLDRAKKQCTMLAVMDHGQWLFPLVQFDPNTPDGVVAGLAEVLKELEKNKLPPLSQLDWLVSKNPYLEDHSPIELLKEGKDRERHQVVVAARGFGEF